MTEDYIEYLCYKARCQIWVVIDPHIKFPDNWDIKQQIDPWPGGEVFIYNRLGPGWGKPDKTIGNIHIFNSKLTFEQWQRTFSSRQIGT